MNRPEDTAARERRLRQLAGELRLAAGLSFSEAPWFAPTLDECRLDIESALTLATADADTGALILRAELSMRTWRRIEAATRAFGSGRVQCDCGGELIALTRPGRTAPFAGHQLSVPDDFAIPTCARCGAESLDPETAGRLDAALFARYLAR
jgi:hypothetical protein